MSGFSQLIHAWLIFACEIQIFVGVTRKGQVSLQLNHVKPCSGRTAIAPGMRRVTCEVSAPPSPTRGSMSLEPTANHQDYFDETGEVPVSPFTKTFNGRDGAESCLIEFCHIA